MTKLETSKMKTLQKFKYLEQHVKRNTNTGHINYKIYHLLCKPETFINAYAKVSRNKGSLTKGVREDTQIMKRFGKTEAKKICEKFKAGTYKWKPGRRVWIPKPGKLSKRPIDTPTQEDRIVQEAIRGILEAIYEPEFRTFEMSNNFTCTNFGFRPNKSCWDAVEHIKLKAKRTSYVIEGDIKQAYNNVNHKLLISILKERIKDKKFLKLINDLLKAGIVDQGEYEHSLRGTPQGGIVSPLLFNIYMFTLDKHIYNRILQPLNSVSSKERENPEFRKLKYQLSQLRKVKNLTESKAEHRQRVRLLLNQKLKTPSKLIETLPKRAVYYRYADDWVLLVTGSITFAKQLKSEIQGMVQELCMELDSEKTNINRLDSGFCFLGFRIKMSSPKQIKRMKVLQKLSNGRYKRVTKRTTTRKITIVPDRERVLGNLVRKGFCKEDYTPKAKIAWIILDEYEIVIKFRHMLIGLTNYYQRCDNLNMMSQIKYILKYSCAKTLARRRKESVRKIFKKYTEQLIIKKQIHSSNKSNVAMLQTELPCDTLLKLRSTPDNLESDFDPFYIQTFWRTKFKIYQECCICGKTEDIAMHHLNSVKSLKTQVDKHRKRSDSFGFIRNQLQRCQIPVCKKCHEDITYGRYNLKQPITYYNEFLAKL